MIDLTQFCSTDPESNIRTPFSQGEYTYATNGHICVRVPRLADVPDRTDAPDMKHVSHHWGSVGATAIDREAFLNLKNVAPRDICPGCRGHKYRVDCDECKGNGDIECDHCGHRNPCRECRGVGYSPSQKDQADAYICEDCTGLGKASEVKYVRVSDDVAFASKYLYQIATLPGRILYIGEKSNVDASYFTFDGGEGLLMPVRISGDEPMLTQKHEIAA